MGMRGGGVRAWLRPGAEHSRAAVVLDRALARARRARATVSRLGMVARPRDAGEDAAGRVRLAGACVAFVSVLGLDFMSRMLERMDASKGRARRVGLLDARAWGGGTSREGSHTGKKRHAGKRVVSLFGDATLSAPGLDARFEAAARRMSLTSATLHKPVPRCATARPRAIGDNANVFMSIRWEISHDVFCGVRGRA